MGAGKLDHCLKCFSYNFKNGICLKCGWKSESAENQMRL
jgi:ribosomal protein L32